MRYAFRLLSLCLLVTGTSSALGDVGRIESVGPQRLIHLAGDPFAMGKAQGQILKSEVRETIRFLIEEHAGKTLGLPEAELARIREKQIPFLPKHYREELRGLAAGAEVDVKRVEMANLVPLRMPGSIGSSLGPKVVGGKLLLAQSIDASAEGLSRWPKPLLVVYRHKVGQPYASITWPGYLGTVAGLNERGIAIGLLDAPIKEESVDGVPAGYLAREALLRAKAMGEAVAIFRDGRRARGAVVLVGDGKIPDARVLEMTPRDFAQFGPDDSAERIVPHLPLADALRRSNHFVDRGLASMQRTQYDPRASDGLLGEESWRRFSKMTAVVQGSNGQITVAESIQQLRRVTDTQAALEQVLLSPSDLELWISNADKSGAEKEPFHRYNLPALLAGKPADKSLAFDTLEKPLDPSVELLARGTVQPKERVDESSIPEIYRLGTESFTFESEPEKVVQGIVRTKVRIPSPITTPFPENNTIYCEYFRPVGEGPFACVIVLHIAGGDFELSRFMANAVAQGGVATVFVKMPFYGERRPPGSNVKMLAPDVGIASGAMQQTVQDLRRVCDWIEGQPDLDGDRIGILGVSLGSITGSLTCAIEPRITHACFIMGGANLHDVIYESTEGEAREYRKLWSESGGTRESLAKVMAPFDAATYADRLRQRVVFMISASEDESIPKASSLALWEAAGRQRIIWYPCGHYTMVKYLMPALGHTVKFFRDWPARQNNADDTANR